MTLQILNQQNYLYPKSPYLSTLSIPQLDQLFKKYKCNGCNLGLQKDLHNPVLYRGNIASKIMIIAESPGLEEDRLGRVLVGPSGVLLDKMFSYIDIDTNKECYLTNVVKCRNICTDGIRQNNTPIREYCDACRPYLDHEINLIKPKIIVLLGRIAIDSFFPSKEKMNKLVGRSILNNNTLFYLMYHPSYILRQQRHFGAYEIFRYKTYEAFRRNIAEHLFQFKKLVKEISNG